MENDKPPKGLEPKAEPGLATPPPIPSERPLPGGDFSKDFEGDFAGSAADQNPDKTDKD